MSILLFIVVLFTLVLVHEWGHYIVAKLTGMRVDEFGIGFPPKLFGIKRGETEYTFNALPIGGFVRILGEDPTQTHNDSARAFSSKSKLAQALVLIAGVTMNILFAWLLFVAIFMIGIPSAVSEENATENAQVIVATVLPNGPAAEFLSVGTEITAVGIADGLVNIENPTPSEFSTFIKENSESASAIEITYTSGGVTETKTVVPQTDVINDSPERKAVGVALATVDTLSYSFVDAVVEATKTTVFSLRDITLGLWGLLSGAVLGTADFSQVAGPVGIVGLVGEAAQFGLTSLLMFTAIISLNLAIINLLPFPALDGGRLVFVAYEAITRREINPVWVSRLNAIGFGLLMLLMIVITYNDIAKLF